MDYYKIFVFTIFSLTLFLSSCEKGILQDQDRIVNYLHLGHTRTNSNPFMDPEVENIDYTKYDMLWLGGDLAYLTSEDDATIEHVDSIFNLGSESTLLTLGKHDYSDLNRLRRFTERPTYYTYFKNGITFIVFDTQDKLCNIKGEQLEMFNSVIDTIQFSSHLVILTHYLIWMYDHPQLHSKIDSISNGRFGTCSYCLNPNNFYEDIYPKLVEIKNKGINVLCIAGDIGINAEQFEYTTEEGIYYLASGINFGSEDNKALLLIHNISNKEIEWEFKLLNQL
jgi:hypothetical protein